MSAEGSGMPGGGCITAGEVRPGQAERRWLSWSLHTDWAQCAPEAGLVHCEKPQSHLEWRGGYNRDLRRLRSEEPMILTQQSYLGTLAQSNLISLPGVGGAPLFSSSSGAVGPPG